MLYHLRQPWLMRHAGRYFSEYRALRETIAIGLSVSPGKLSLGISRQSDRRFDYGRVAPALQNSGRS
jgi:uroporphyrinogen-III decarboxylase